MSRKNISKKLRFEIFKRDSFRCQYCGATAPDVLLRVDHINPVSNGGDNNILNLVTSCFDCNSGKSDRLLSENTVLDKQRKQLEDLENRRSQLEMMMEWHKSLTGVNGLKAKSIIEYINDLSPNKLKEEQEKIIRRLVKKYEIDELIDAIDSSFGYYKNRYNGVDLIEVFMKKLSGVLIIQKREKEDPDYAFIKEIYNYTKSLRNYSFEFNFKQIEKMFKTLKKEGIQSLEIVSIMCSKNWNSIEELSFHVEDFIKTPQINENEILIKIRGINLIPKSPSFDDILKSWLAYYVVISADRNKRKECFLVLLDNLNAHGYKKYDLINTRKEKIIKSCFTPPYPFNKIKFRALIDHAVKCLEEAISIYYGLSIAKVEQNLS
jgi:hypothetical protein